MGRGGRILLALAMAGALAGCADLIDGAATVASTLGTLTANGPLLSAAGCEQTHAFFTYPAQAFADALPNGFTLTTDDRGATTTFLLSTSSCEQLLLVREASAEPRDKLSETWGLLFVEPPEGTPLRDDVIDVLPLGMIIQSTAAAATYAVWGFGSVVAEGNVSISTSTTPGLAVSLTHATSADETYELRASVPRDTKDFHPGVFRMWIPVDNGAEGSILYAWAGGEDIGLGSGMLVHGGDPLEQPPFSGAVVHHVHGVGTLAAKVGVDDLALLLDELNEDAR